MNKKKIIIIIGVLVLFLVSLITVGLITKNKYSKKISNLEKIHIQEFINDYGVSLEQVDTDETKENDRYISYALYYNLDDTNKVSLSNKEIKGNIKRIEQDDKFIYQISTDENYIEKVKRIEITTQKENCKITEIKMYNSEENELYSMIFESFMVKK